MPITDLIPWKKKEPEQDAIGGELQVRQEPFAALQQQMNRMFDEFFQGPGLEPFGAFQQKWDAFSPRVDVVENDKEIEISVELPGMEEKEIDVALTQHSLTVSGEKRHEREEKGENYLRSERSYGSFRRTIPLSSDVDAGEADATFRNGVLTVTLPRAVKAETRKRIAIKAQ
jgi:HSP20 family protein